MALSWEIDYRYSGKISIMIWSPQSHFVSLASRKVVGEHGRVLFLEELGNAFTHHANAVHSVHQRLQLAGKDVADQRFDCCVGFHCSVEEYVRIKLNWKFEPMILQARLCRL